MGALIPELQRDTLNKDISVSSLLRKAFVAAKKLKIQEFEKWIELELNGYDPLGGSKPVHLKDKWAKLPKYRWMTGELKVTFLDSGSKPRIPPIQYPLWVSIGEIEAILDNKSSSSNIHMPPNEDAEVVLREHLRGRYESEYHVPKHQLHKIQETVRNIILEWALKLEEKGIFGDGLAFSANEKEIASNITFNIEQLIQKGGTEMKVEIANSTVGLLNTGEMLGESITASISTLADSNQHQIAEAFKSLTETVKASQDISSQKQTEILEQLELLSAQATLAPPDRKAGLIKPTLSALAATLSAGGGLAEIWSKWGNVIEDFFGIGG